MRSITTEKKIKSHLGIGDGMIHDFEENSPFNFRYQKKMGESAGDRIIARDGIYAVIESLSPQICQITDMGEDGMSFIYFSDSQLNERPGTVDFLVTGFGFKLERVPFKIVEDFRISSVRSGSLDKRVARVMFNDLGNGRKEMVRNFITHFIMGTVN